MKCTWDGCERDGAVPQLSRDGKEWSCLCEEHDREIIEAIEKGDAKAVLRSWVKAQGGAKAAARRSMGE